MSWARTDLDTQSRSTEKASARHITSTIRQAHSDLFSTLILSHPSKWQMCRVAGCAQRATSMISVRKLLVHLPQRRSVNRCLRCRDRVALRFWGSRPGCDCYDHPSRKSDPEHKSEGSLSAHLSLLMSDSAVQIKTRKRNKLCDRHHNLVE